MGRAGRLLRAGALGALVGLAAPMPWAAAHAAGTKYLMSGGNSGSGASVRYTAPGHGNIYGANFPAAGLGEQAAQIRMRAARIGKLRVSILTESATSGSVVVTVRVNGVPTMLTCTVGFAGGNCGSNDDINVQNGDRLAVEIASTLNQGAWTFTYTLQGN